MRLYSRVVQVLLALPLLGAATSPEDHGRCRCTSKERCWPSDNEWKALNNSIDGRLAAIKPIGHVCHDPSFGESTCHAVSEKSTNSSWRVDQPAALQWVNWEQWLEKNESCHVDTLREVPCGQGRVPYYSALVQTAKHVQQAVRFASKHNLRLVIKNTGHDFVGRSSAPESFQIFTHQMKNIEFTDKFVPQGGKDVGQAVTVDAGVQLHELYAALAKQKKIAVIGFSHGVGVAGGYIQGGGHSPLGPFAGMSVDNALEFELVTADGNLTTANDYQNQDLFWALRGGGGGTFGVVVRVSLRTFPDIPAVVSTLNVTCTACQSNNSFWKAVEILHVNLPALCDGGASGYYFITPDDPIIGNASGSGSTITLPLFFPDQADSKAADTLMTPLLSSLREIPGIDAQFESLFSPSFSELFKGFLSGTGGGGSGSTSILGSRLISRDFLSRDDGPARVSKALSQLKNEPGNSIVGHLVAGGKVAENKDLDIALNPAWRRTLTHIDFPRRWASDASLAEQDAIKSNLTDVEVPLLSSLEPDMGAYGNEADPNEPNFQKAFWGSNYPRLYAIKQLRDPRNLFIVRAGVGSEDWDDDGLCRI